MVPEYFFSTRNANSFPHCHNQDGIINVIRVHSIATHFSVISYDCISGGLAVPTFRDVGRLVSGARRSVQHGARDRYRSEHRSAEENGFASKHRRRER